LKCDEPTTFCKQRRLFHTLVPSFSVASRFLVVAVLEAHDDGRVADGASPALSLDCAKPLAAPPSLDDSVSADRALKKRQVCSTNTSTITSTITLLCCRPDNCK
jgi:hypothetical protein